MDDLEIMDSNGDNKRRKRKFSEDKELPGQLDSHPNVITSTDANWRLALCHVPVEHQTKFADIETFFGTLRLKEIRQVIMNGQQTAFEVAFWTEEDMHRAIENCNHKFFKTHRVTLKKPGEIQEEMDKAKDLWNGLPWHLKEGVFSELTSSRYGSVFTRVCQQWKSTLLKFQEPRFCQGVFVIEQGGHLDDSFLLQRPCRLGTTNLVLISPSTSAINKLKEFFHANTQVKQLTIVRCNHLQIGEAYSSTAYSIMSRFTQKTTILIVDTYCAFWLDFEVSDTNSSGRFAIRVPWLKVSTVAPHRLAEEYEDDYNTKRSQHLFVRRVLRAIDALDLWWSYSAETTEWLRDNLTRLNPHQECIVQKIIRDSTTVNERQWYLYGYPTDGNTRPTGVFLNGRSLNPRECAVVAQCLAHLRKVNVSRNSNITPVPFEQPNVHLTAIPYIRDRTDEFACRNTVEAKWSTEIDELRRLTK